MSKKHFIVLAAALRLHREQYPASPAHLRNTDELIETIASVCKSQNKLFSFDRFYTASNYKGRDHASN